LQEDLEKNQRVQLTSLSGDSYSHMQEHADSGMEIHFLDLYQERQSLEFINFS